MKPMNHTTDPITGPSVRWALTIFVILSLILPLAPVAAVAPQAPLAADQVGYWRFDEGSGAAAGDSSSYGNNGTVSGAAWTTGKVSGALSFDGVDDRVEVPASASLSLSTNRVTLAGWVYPTAVTGGFLTLAQRTNAAGTWFDWQLYARASDAPTANHPVFRVDWNGSGTLEADEQVQGDIILQANTWYFIAATYDGSAMQFYIDGTVRGTTAKTGGTIPNGNQPIWLGGNSAWGEHFPGKIDEVQIYNRALSQAEIQALMVSGPTISITGTPLGAFNSTPGVPSAQQSYTVSGSNLTGNIAITAPADFEISTTSGSGFTSALSLTQVGGVVSATTIYVRFNRATAGVSSGNIAHASAGATTQNVAVTGTATAGGAITFAAFGDYGSNSSNELAVANMVKGWNPDFIITTGDNSYGGTAIDTNIGQYYHAYIGNYVGSYGSGSATNRFFPSMGNHDYTDGGGSTAYFNYFTLPNNERYYDFVQGPVHFFVIDSNPAGTGSAPGDGRSAGSAQGTWLQAQLAASTAPWKIVYMHHPPYSSGSVHGSETAMRWPYEAWGATAVLAGHDHVYERILRDDDSDGASMPYFTTGAGGMSLYGFGTPVTGSQVRYNANYGSMRVQASSASITFEFWSVAGGGTLIDSYTINSTACTPATESFDALTLGARIGTVAGWTDNGSAGPAVGAGGVAGTQGLGAGSSIFNWSAHPFLWSDAGLSSVAFEMDFQTNASGAFDDDRLAWMTENTPGSSQYNFGIQLDPDTDGTACPSGQNIETYWRNPAFSTDTADRIETTIACLPTLSANSWYRARLVITKLTAASASFDVTLTALDAGGNPGAVVASGTVADTSAWPGGAAPAAYFSPSGTSTALYPSYKNHNGTTGNADNAVADVCSAAAPQYTLTAGNDGHGVVTLSPSGGTYNQGATVILTPVADAGYAFSSWSGPDAGDLTDNGNGSWSIVMDADKSVTANFVVSSCTTVSFQQGASGYTGARDAHIRQANPTFNYGVSTPLMVDSDEPAGSSNDVSTLLYWDLSSIPAGSTIQSAAIAIYVEDVTAAPGYDLYDMTQAWTEGTGNGSATGNGATWNTFDGSNAWPGGAGASGSRGSTVLANFAPTATGAYQTSLNAAGRSVLQGWVNTPANNKGFMISAGATTNGLDFTSKEGAAVANRPRLEVTYCLASTDPTIVTAGALTAFSAEPGAPSAEQSYTVSGSNLTGDITITPPADFELSLTSGSGFATTPIVLAPSGGSVASTAIYVRFNRATAGASSGNITHTSSGATQKNVAVSGVAASGWVAFNDMNPFTGDANATHVTRHTYATTNGVLVNYNTGAPLAVTVSGATVGGYDPNHPTNGGQANAGTDAGGAFGPAGAVIVDLANTLELDDPSWDHVVTFNNLNPAKEYALTLSANRNEPTYDGARFTRVTIQGADLYVNASSSGVVVNSPDSVSFSTGYNTVTGYVAKWTGIKSGADGSFSIKSEWDNVLGSGANNTKGYAMSAFKLEEGQGAPATCYTLTLSHTGQGSDPIATPANSTGCAAGQYVAGAAIQLSGATPASGWRIGSWTGTANDGSTAGTNSLTMPAGAHAAAVNYVETTVGWSAYNDCVYDPTRALAATDPNGQLVHYKAANVTTYGVGSGFPPSGSGYTSSGILLDQATGAPTGVTASLTQSGGVTWQPDISSSWNGGYDTATGTDARNTFGGIADMTGVIYYGSSGWWVDLTFTGLDPARQYTFATSSSRANSAYTARVTRYTLSGADAATNASTAGVTVVDNLTVAFNTGDNHSQGYVARWTGIQPGSDGSFKVRAEAHTAEYRAYAFDVFMLQEEAGAPPTCYALTLGHTGQGSDPVAAPANSPGCAAGQYVAGANIALSGAVPAAGWQIGSWSGTVNDSSTASANSVTMPASAHAAAVNYVQPPNQPVLVAPVDAGYVQTLSPELTVTVSDPDSASLTVTFYGREAGAGSGADFTVIALPDTQFYSESYPATFAAQTQWIVNNQAGQNIVYVAHEGDIVNVAGSIGQWTNADAAMDILDAAGITYGVVPGNHDDSDGGTNYNAYFGVSRFTGKSFYGGSYPAGDNQNSYTLFSASGMDFIVINLDYISPAANSLDWADGLLKANPGRRGIVVSHDILSLAGAFDPWGQQIYNALKDNPNLFLMLCGHNHGESRRSDPGDDGHTIYSLLADYQSYANGGNGFLRILQFSPANNEIRVKTYSPTLDAYETDSASEFVLSYNMDGTGPFALLGAVNGVASGANASWTWPNLAPGTMYEWYVTVSDGTTTVTGPVWTFTTVDKPKAPVMQSITLAPTPSDITLTWEAVTQDVKNHPTVIDYYQVFRSTDPYFTTGGTQLTPDPATPSFTDAGAAASMTSWYYLVRAHNGAGSGDGSSLARKIGKFTFGLVSGGP